MAAEPGERIAEEQAALRRVATLIARAAPPEEVFAAVSAEVGGFSADLTTLSRHYPDGAGTVVGTWFEAGSRVACSGRPATGTRRAEPAHVGDSNGPA
jgi:GAF domain-containing protein